jgi:uncharacterized protein (DUF427 family)
MKAVWNGAVVAESTETIVVEGNHYFPRTSLVAGCFEESQHKTSCSWKGEASYLSVRVGDAVNKDAAWYYPAPKDAAQEIAGYVAFWKGVKVEE